MGEGDATPKRNHANSLLLSAGERAVGALGSSRHTRSRGMLRACISDSTPCSWHSASACACAGACAGEAEAEAGVGSEVARTADRDALAARERCVKAMEASGPASVRMC